MKRVHPSTHQSFVVLLLAVLAGCGDRAAADRPPAVAAADQGPPAPDTCPTEAEVGEAIGMPVRSTGQRRTPCFYQADGYSDVSIELRVAPANLAVMTFERIKSSAKAMSGSSAEVDRIDLGEGGWAFGSNSLSEAAAVAQGWVYHARMEYLGDLGNTIGNKKDAMIRLVAKMMG
jgi:hypothetical protein